MKITIIGAAGNVGSCAAFNIAIHEIADELVMVDSFSPDKLEQFVFDLGSAVTDLKTKVRRGNDEDMSNSDIVIMAAGSAQFVASRQEILPQNLPIIMEAADKIKRFCPKAIVMTATNPVCPLNYAMYLRTGFDRRKIIGYSDNDSIRFRMFVAQALEVDSSQVEATVIGEHGNSQVLLFSSVRLKGKPVLLNSDIKEKVRQQVANLPKTLEGQRIKTGRTAAWTTSMGITAICRAISNDTGEMIPCSVTLEGEYGYHDLGMSVPTIIGKDGVREIQEWELEADEHERLEYSITSLRSLMVYVDEFLKT